jgi:hypothetical protein
MAPDMIARRDWTRDWWDNHRRGYLLVTSEAVLDELTRGDCPSKEKAPPTDDRRKPFGDR